MHAATQSWSYATNAQLGSGAAQVWDWQDPTNGTPTTDRNSIITYNTGAILTTGTAAARRVGVGTGTTALTNLTAAGSALIVQTINWAVGPAVTVNLPGWERSTYNNNAVQVRYATHGNATVSYRRSTPTTSDNFVMY